MYNSNIGDKTHLNEPHIRYIDAPTNSGAPLIDAVDSMVEKAVSQFIAECVVARPGQRIGSMRVFLAYSAWATHNTKPTCSADLFFGAMRLHGLTSTQDTQPCTWNNMTVDLDRCAVAL